MFPKDSLLVVQDFCFEKPSIFCLALVFWLFEIPRTANVCHFYENFHSCLSITTGWIPCFKFSIYGSLCFVEYSSSKISISYLALESWQSENAKMLFKLINFFSQTDFPPEFLGWLIPLRCQWKRSSLPMSTGPHNLYPFLYWTPYGEKIHIWFYCRLISISKLVFRQNYLLNFFLQGLNLKLLLGSSITKNKYFSFVLCNFDGSEMRESVVSFKMLQFSNSYFFICNCFIFPSRCRSTFFQLRESIRF